MAGGRRFVGEFALDARVLDVGHRPGGATDELADVGHGTLLLHGVLSPAECQALAGAIPDAAWEPVGLDGMRPGFDPATAPIGSWRASAYSEPAAEVIWRRIADRIDREPAMGPDTPTDWVGRRWRAVGVNPLLRFIRYEDGGLLIPHYDAPYVASDSRRTLQSLVIYLAFSPRELAPGGRTRFLHDPQLRLPFHERDHRDWPRLAEPSEIRAVVDPEVGAGLLFYHRLLHDSDAVRGTKLLCRTDVVFGC